MGRLCENRRSTESTLQPPFTMSRLYQEKSAGVDRLAFALFRSTEGYCSRKPKKYLGASDKANASR